MGQSVSRSYMCCSVRDKHAGSSIPLPLGAAPQFESIEVDVQLEKPIFTSFAPLHQRQEVPLARRIAMASKREVHVHRLPDAELSTLTPPLHFPLCNRLRVDEGQAITGICFVDEDNSRQLAVAFGPEDPTDIARLGFRVRVFNCEGAVVGVVPPRENGQAAMAGTGFPEHDAPIEWKLHEGFHADLFEHTSRIVKLAVNRTYLLTGDESGECRVWQKTRAYTRRAAAKLHRFGIADLSADRLFAYSAGIEEPAICVWALPDLSPVLNVPIDIPTDLLAGLSSFDTTDGAAHLAPMAMQTPTASASSAGAPARSSSSRPLVACAESPRMRANGACRVGHLSSFRRPLSRWAGWQGSSRGPKVPRGVILIAGVLSDTCEVSPGAGVLMEWSLGVHPACRSALVAHPTPIVNMVYGPYDNGPLVTSDAKGLFRVWDMNVLDRGLRLSQQIDVLCFPRGDIRVCVEQPRGLYVVTPGGKLHVWQRINENY